MISSTGNSSSAISYTSLQHSINTLSSEKMFRKLSGKTDNADLAVAKNQTENNIGHSQSDENQVENNGIIRDASTSNVSYLKPKTKSDGKDASEPQIIYGSHKNEEEFFYDGKSVPPISSFDTLAAEIGAIGDKISKEQLMAYLESLKTKGTSSASDSVQIAFVKNLIAKFDTLSNGAQYITSLTGINEPQDYKTITKEQVTPPFDLRV